MTADRTGFCTHSIRGERVILLIGGDETGNAHWYEEYVPRADAIYAQHLQELDDSRNLQTRNDP
jgi:hypothetical protein